MCTALETRRRGIKGSKSRRARGIDRDRVRMQLPAAVGRRGGSRASADGVDGAHAARGSRGATRTRATEGAASARLTIAGIAGTRSREAGRGTVAGAVGAASGACQAVGICAASCAPCRPGEYRAIFRSGVSGVGLGRNRPAQESSSPRTGAGRCTTARRRVVPRAANYRSTDASAYVDHGSRQLRVGARTRTCMKCTRQWTSRS